MPFSSSVYCFQSRGVAKSFCERYSSGPPSTFEVTCVSIVNEASQL